MRYDARNTHRRQKSQILRPQPVAATEQRLSSSAVLASSHDVFKRGDRFEDLNRVPIQLFRVLHHPHCVAPRRKCAAGPYAESFPSPDGVVDDLSHAHLTGDPEERGRGLTGAERVRSAYCEPVHGGAVKARQIFSSCYRLANHPIERVPGGDLLQVKGVELAEKLPHFFPPDPPEKWFYHVRSG